MENSAWTYFTKEKGGEKAECLICSKLLSCKGSSTSGLIRHLQHIHKLNLLKRTANDELPSSSNVSTKPTNQPQTLTTSCTKKQSMSEIVARLAAIDGFSIRGISNSEFIHQAFKDRQYDLPNDKDNIMKLIHEFYNLAKCEVITEIKSHKDNFGKFSLTIDEWTSSRNRRYLNINIHFNKKYINLGSIRIAEKGTADTIIKQINSKLSDFGLNLSDIVASTTDSAAFMVKYGKLSKHIHQLCYNQGIHLAVVDVIYNVGSPENEYSSTNDDFSETDTDEPNPLTQRCEINDIKTPLQMLRKIVKFFKTSPIKNLILQEHVKVKYGKELNLVLDTKTKWNSIVAMIERFLIIIDSVRDALKDLDSLALLDENNVTILRNICNALKPIELAAQALGRRDANLVTADAILKFLFDSLQKNDDDLSRQLLEALKFRIIERRNQNLVSLTKYLQTLDLQSINDLPSSSKTVITSYAREIFKKLFYKDSDCDRFEKESDSGPVCDINDRLDDAINAALKNKKLGIKMSDDANILAFHDNLQKDMAEESFHVNLQNELQIYESTGNITKNLKRLLDALMTIQPTSIESGKVFTTSSKFFSKKRYSTSDLSFDCLSFLKCYFLNKQ